ncbi:MerR family transcriptional regulator [Lysinimonas soli]|uniref:MerR family transcriptional regulator n=1 Tax=Lysinimonas soli TaxID=1074233 RepID=A0ABW0NR96_9MICO
MTLTDSALSISDVAAETGLSTSTLRYYEQEGLLLDEVGRASSSHRRYAPEVVGWLTFITRLRSTGMPIRDIRRYAELVRQGEHTTPDRLELLVAHRERVLEQLAEAQRSLAAIDYKISSYERFSTK